MKTLKFFFLAFLFVFSVSRVNAQMIKIISIGNSITQGSLDSNFLKPFNYTILKSWRYPLWYKMDSANIKFDMIGSLNQLNQQNSRAAIYPKSHITNHIFDSAHEARWGASSDSIKIVLRTLKNKDTADIALIHIGGSDGDTNAITTIANIDTIINLLRAKNSYLNIFLAKVISAGSINDSITALATRVTKPGSPVTVVDLQADWDSATMTLDGIVPDSTGEKIIAQKFYNAILTQDLSTTVNAPTGIQQTCKTIHTICISWNASLTPSMDIFSGYDIYANNIKMNKYLIKNTSFNIQNLDIVSAYNIKVVAVDARTNIQRSSSTFSFSTDGYAVSFIVKNKNSYIKDAKIVFNSTTKVTGTYGDASFAGIAPGKRGYVITKAGFNDLVVNNQDIKNDTTFNVNLTSVSLSEDMDQIFIFPNPSKGMVTIQNAEGSILELSNLTGTMLEKLSCKDLETRWDLSKYESGTYFITIKKGEAFVTRKLILTK